jgi:hypothetical protein
LVGLVLEQGGTVLSGFVMLFKEEFRLASVPFDASRKFELLLFQM